MKFLIQVLQYFIEVISNSPKTFKNVNFFVVKKNAQS